MNVQKLEPNQCSLMHVWDLGGKNGSTRAWLADPDKKMADTGRDAFLVVGRHQRVARRALSTLWNPFGELRASKHGRTRVGGTIYIVRREAGEERLARCIATVVGWAMLGVVAYFSFSLLKQLVWKGFF